MAAIPSQVLGAFALKPSSPPVRLQRGSLNRNFRVETDAGRFFVRQHRPDVDRDRIEREHRIISWAGERGIPVVYPLRADNGSTVVEEDGLWAAFPWVKGKSVRRDRITVSQAFLLGELHGRTQVAMRGQPDASGSSAMRWNTPRTIEAVEALLGQVASESGEEHLRSVLGWQLRCLNAGMARPFQDFAHLPVQALHMDYHDRQTIWDKGTIIALVDWEMAGANPRVYELVRALHFSLLTRQPYLEAYLGGFSRHVTLTDEECVDGVELWWQTRLHDTWTPSEYLLRGNRRVRPFLRTGFEQSRHLADPQYRLALAQRLWAAAH